MDNNTGIEWQWSGGKTKNVTYVDYIRYRLQLDFKLWRSLDIHTVTVDTSYVGCSNSKVLPGRFLL